MDPYVQDIETALSEAIRRGPSRSPMHRTQDEEIVSYYIRRRDRMPKRDQLTPRMEARRIIDALDLARSAR